MPVTTPEVAVLIGRFQPFHRGHATLLQKALETAPRVVIVLGSSFHARSAKNPFNWRERAAMIGATLPAAERERVSYVAVRDYYEDKRWARAVQNEVSKLHPDARRIALIGHFKDASSQYLNLFPQWQLVSSENAFEIDATRIRRILFEAEDIDVSLTVIAELVPLAVRQYLQAWSKLACFAPLVQEHQQLQKYKAAWSTAPYPPIFVTVDAVVRSAGHVLLVQRGGFPGKGLWAIPGGFVEQHERLLPAAMRELFEETGIAVLASSLNDAFIEAKAFDHPERSLRGRTITHAHYFDLKTEHLPAVQGADDAAVAVWVPIAQLAAMEESFFDDHFHILDQFLRLSED
ncbi:bifunctional nicotinamide-nucleotide adenylyltransferase/Nudix hydroxylase [Paraherbaspirillum soli]|uniref:Bifunctional nicotinamide-nucleotide adenylyltransferase/Nudix hydroxylase n=1 Tax=Paraherbaspirillum soli TaxID=631222 RepID=A0ABW0M7N4_9BURK